ncbi:hypothetical protein GYMLUDRAFT_881076 [Collybiopsis luxurians FD-317 M1]|uniref:Uncharacterized protein n=1 Tax=Collybiopsis luxurians FD-317 M1 TaxID=944289 RepID=A0A0D0BK65_9AGAR|nr:hypothetical protein GYMLUDRAFT_881076 [Collybiopsis luxurians FD-317 M1]
MIENAKSTPRVYFETTRDTVDNLRSVDDLKKTRRQREVQKERIHSAQFGISELSPTHIFWWSCTLY